MPKALDHAPTASDADAMGSSLERGAIQTLQRLERGKGSEHQVGIRVTF